MIKPNYKQYKEEKEKWKEAGEPLRTPERVAELFEICNNCEHHIKITDSILQCSRCSCFLRQKGTKLNKLAYATTRCPLEEPKWIEEGVKKEVVEEIPQQPQKIRRPPKTGGCGCGG